MMYRLRESLTLAREPHLGRALLAIQSDDWGYPCVTDNASLLRAWPGLRDADASPWAFDARDSPEDLEALAKLLAAHRDADGRPARATLNLIVGRPDYAGIARTGFDRYLAAAAPTGDAAFSAALVGERQGVFELALHGGEHLAPAHWLRLLRNGDMLLRSFFDAGAMPPHALIARHPGLGAACLPCPEEPDRDEPLRRLRAAVRDFESICGRAPDGFVAPNHAWDRPVEQLLVALGMRYMQACHVHYADRTAVESGRWESRRTGPSAHSSIWYQTRTVDFEPAVRPDLVGAAIGHACRLARLGIPVIVNAHRINFVGAIDPKRATLSRTALGQLLRAVMEARPDLSFVSSAELDAILRTRHPTLRRPRVITVARRAHAVWNSAPRRLSAGADSPQAFDRATPDGP